MTKKSNKIAALDTEYAKKKYAEFQQQQANAEMKEVNADVDQLHQDVSLLKDDEYVAKLARSKFFYSKDGEKVYPILESNTDSSTNETDQSTSSTTAK